jgi:hypothetical protein
LVRVLEVLQDLVGFLAESVLGVHDLLREILSEHIKVPVVEYLALDHHVYAFDAVAVQSS